MMLLHAAVNNTKDIVPSANPAPTGVFHLDATPVAWMSVTLFWLVALYLLVDMRGADVKALVDPVPGPSSRSDPAAAGI